MAHETFDFRKSIRLLEGGSDAIEELFIVSIPNCILMAMTTTRSLNYSADESGKSQFIFWPSRLV